MRNRFEGPATLLLVVAILGSMSACADRSTTGPRSAASRGVARDVAEEPAAPAEKKPAEESVCPDGLKPLEVKPGDKADANGNGIVCTDGGKIVVDDLVGAGSCPERFTLVQVEPGGRGDENGNGFVCTDGGKIIVDDVIESEGGKVNGHGNYFSGDLDLSFSFHGQSDKKGGAKGEFELHDQTNGFNVHGDVYCVEVTGNSALLNGEVTKSDDPDLPVGTNIGWIAVDNGEGANDAADQISRVGQVSKKTGKGGCATFKKTALEKIISGNIQVH